MIRILTIIALLIATPACTPINTKGENKVVVGNMVGGLILTALVYQVAKKDNGDNNPNPICRSPCGPADEVCIAVCPE